MSLKNKILFDVGLLIAICFVLAYNFTGNLLHEIIGIVLIAGFFLHIILHMKYYLNMTRKIISGENIGTKRVISYVTNVIMLIASFAMLMSSVAISKDLFSFLNFTGDGYSIWRTIHIVSAIIISLCSLVHLILHFSMIAALFNSWFKQITTRRIVKVCSCIMVFVVSIFVINSSVHNIRSLVVENSFENYELDNPKNNMKNSNSEETLNSNLADSKKKDTLSEYTKKEDEITGNTSLNSSDGSEDTGTKDGDEDIPTLTEYLQSLYCSGCGRHCSLISPRCHKGDIQAETARTEYYTTYNISES